MAGDANDDDDDDGDEMILTKQTKSRPVKVFLMVLFYLYFRVQ